MEGNAPEAKDCCDKSESHKCANVKFDDRNIHIANEEFGISRNGEGQIGFRRKGKQGPFKRSRTLSDDNIACGAGGRRNAAIFTNGTRYAVCKVMELPKVRYLK